MTFKKLTYLFASLAFGLGFCACDHDDPKEDEQEELSVYVAFNYDSLAPNMEMIHCAAIWNDGKIMKLSSGREDVYVYDVYMSQIGDIYAAGNFDKQALYWKNGEEYPLPSGRAASGVGVLNGKVYCCGYNVGSSGDQAMMWVDGKDSELKGGSRCNSLSIGNGTCYIAGYGERSISGEIKEDALYWVNGSPMSYLRQDNNTVDNAAQAMDLVYGEALWIVGQEKKSAASWIPKVWVDLNHNDLCKEGMNTSLNSITYENGTYYIAGNDGLKAVYWTAQQKSKSERRPSNVSSVVLADERTQSTVTDIAVMNGQVYCVGYTRPAGNTYQPMLWLNGKAQSFKFPMTYNNIVPQSIVVAKKEK